MEKLEKKITVER